MAEIVKLLSKNLKIPSSLLGLKTIGTHPAQASLSPNERLKHIKGKFKATAKTVANKRLLLIDDVITSGASIVGATTALLESGAANIDCLSICRSDLFTQLRQEIHLKIPHKFNRLAR